VPRFQNIRTVPFSADEMFALVADSREQRDDGTGHITATMGIGYKAIRETFTTRVDLDAANRTIVVRHQSGPFRRLENVWTFTPLNSSASDVRFAIDYEFSSPLLAVVMGAVFDTAFRKFAQAFEDRAGEVYGRRALVSSALT
jgi:coenzyme Q-binding protein COQ10